MALRVALLAALAAAAGPAPPAPPAPPFAPPAPPLAPAPAPAPSYPQRADYAIPADSGVVLRARHGDTELFAEGVAGGEGGGGGAGGEVSEADVAAWRELWAASLEALRREPSLNTTPEDVVAQLGSVAFLHCPVRNLGERGVSWVRRRDWHIISSGVLMYTNDERFQILHGEGSDDWILQIKYVQKRDNGTYECQVSTARGTLARRARLQVAVPEAFILGADEHHVDAGSSISLVCIIDKSPVPPQYVFWYHNARMINYDASAGVSVVTEPGARTQSALTVRSATPRHSGNYTCRAANAEPAHIHVYVSEGSDKMAATLSRNTAHVAFPRCFALTALLLIFCECCTC